MGFSKLTVFWTLLLGACQNPVTVGESFLHLHPGNVINLHYPLLDCLGRTQTRIYPPKQTCPLKRGHFKKKVVLKSVFFQGVHVSFLGSNLSELNSSILQNPLRFLPALNLIRIFIFEQTLVCVCEKESRADHPFHVRLVKSGDCLLSKAFEKTDVWKFSAQYLK